MTKHFLAKRLLPLLPALLFLLLPLKAEAAGDDDFYKDKSWEDLAAIVIAEAEATEQTAALGYINTVTGEEHYYNGDSYFAGASLYKLPLNMYCAEQITRGERSWDSETRGRPYREIQSSSLTYSNNPLSLALVSELGGWQEFRTLIASYVGEDPTDEDYTLRHNLFTSRQMTRCAALLARESDRFPGVVDCLLESAPTRFFNYADLPYDVAQKYANNIEDGNVFHAAGIIYTDDPIALVVLTGNLASQRLIMERYCELMCGYTQYQRSLRLEEEARLAAEAAREAAEQDAAQRAAEEEAARLAAEEEAARLAEEAAIRREAEALAAERSAQRQRLALCITAAALVAAGCIVALFILHKRK